MREGNCWSCVIIYISVYSMCLYFQAISMALLEYPVLNSSVNQQCTELTTHSHHHIGVAMDTPKGLIVPVVRNIQDKSLVEIAKDLNILQVTFCTPALFHCMMIYDVIINNECDCCYLY